MDLESVVFLLHQRILFSYKKREHFSVCSNLTGIGKCLVKRSESGSKGQRVKKMLALISKYKNTRDNGTMVEGSGITRRDWWSDTLLL